MSNQQLTWEASSPSGGVAETQGMKRGYMLTLTYSGQQAAGISSFISLQCWAGSLPVYVVEPFIKESTLGNIINSNETDTLRFSDFFDIDIFNKWSRNEGCAPLTTWEDFLANAPRNVILVRMFWGNDMEVLWDGNTTGDPGCYKAPKFQTFLTENKFCIVKVLSAPYLINHDGLFTLKELKLLSPSNSTILFTFWNAIPKSLYDFDKLRPSQQLLQYVEKYENTYLRSGNSVAVMLRLEHLVQELFYTNASLRLRYDECLQEVVDTVQSLQKEVVSNTVFVTSDVGQYGSGTWDKYIYAKIMDSIGKDYVFQIAKETVSTLYRHKMTFEQWEDTFSRATGGIEDRGYIAALQRTIASRADCLVLVGGGKFLRLTLEEYLYNHPEGSEQCVRFVCLREEEVYEEMISATLMEGK